MEIIKGLTEESYNQIDAIRSGHLKAALISPAHYLARKNEPSEDTDALKFGRALHHAVFEPEVFKTLYTAKPEGLNLGTIEGKQWKKSVGDKEILSHEEYTNLEGMYNAILNHKHAYPLLMAGDPEVTVVWENPDTGLKCKAKYDRFHEKCKVDLKSTRNLAHWDHYQYEFLSKKYRRDIQAVHYMEPFPEQSFYHVVIEKNPPYGIKIHPIHSLSLLASKLIRRDALFSIKNSMESGIFNSYNEDIEDVNLPEFLLGGIND